MTASLFPESFEQQDAVISQLKAMGFTRSGKFHGDLKMSAVIDGVKHVALIETVELD